MTATIETEAIMTVDEAKRVYANEETLALDLETSGLSPWNDQIHVITLYGPKSQRPTILHYPAGEQVPQDVLDWLSSFPEIVTHNGALFDLQFLWNAGMDIFRPSQYDTMIGELAVSFTHRNAVRVNLADTAKRRLGVKIDKEIDHAGWGAPELTPDHIAYVLGDISHLIDLKASQFERADEIDASPENQKPSITPTRFALDFESRLMRPMIRMKNRGFPVDLERVNAYLDSQDDKLVEAKATLVEHLGPINFNSNPQLMAALAQAVDGVPLPTKKEHYERLIFNNTTADRLKEISGIPGKPGLIARALLDYRYVAKRKSMYGKEWQDKDCIWHGDHYRVHGNFWQNGTDTGRMSSTNPNMQQIPKDMRFCFGGRPGHLIGKTDYSAIEVRVAAALAPDFKMIETFRSGKDIHTVVGSAGFSKPYEEITKQERQIAKAMSFTLLFGGSVNTFRSYAAHNGSSIGMAEAQQAFDNFFAEFTGIERMRAKAEQLVMQYQAGHVPLLVHYRNGLKRHLIGPTLRPTVFLNNLVQGTASVGLKKALLLMEERGISSHLCAVVHDEIVYEATPDELPELRTEIERCMIEGMHWALDGEEEIPIAVESTWGETWAGDKMNVHTEEW